MMDFILPAIVIGPVLIGLLSFLFPRKMQWLIFFLTNIVLLGAVFYIRDRQNLFFLFELSYFPVNKLTMGMAYSQLGWFFLAISTVATLLFSAFSLGFNDKKHATAIAPLWLILVGASNGIFMAHDWLWFFIVWESMSWTSLLIIGHGRNKSFKAGIFYYLLSLAGTFALLMSIWLIFRRTGNFEIGSGILYLARASEGAPLYALVVLALFTLAFFTKSALFPFHMWPSLAHAEAPDDFSAYLSGIMIKYGIFGLLLVVIPVFAASPLHAFKAVSGVPLPLYFTGWISAVTAAWGTIMAIFSSDMKKLMAWSTVANVGYIGAALSTGTSLGYAAALFHTANHMFFKGAIFASLAAVKYRTGEREMHKLGGLAYVMPITFFTFLLGIIAAAGIPPLSGFASKWMIFQALFERKLVFQSTMIFFASTGAFLYLFRALHTVFLGQLPRRFAKVKEVGPFMSLSMTGLMLLMLIPGTAPGTVLKPVNSVLGSLGFEQVKTGWFFVQGSTTAIDGGIITFAFVLAVAVVFLLFVLGGKKKKVEMLDNYTSGETPEDWNLTEERYHYGNKFYQPIEVLFKWVPLGAVEEKYRQFGKSLVRLGNLIHDFFQGQRVWGWQLVAGIALLIGLGVM